MPNEIGQTLYTLVNRYTGLIGEKFHARYIDEHGISIVDCTIIRSKDVAIDRVITGILTVNIYCHLSLHYVPGRQ